MYGLNAIVNGRVKCTVQYVPGDLSLGCTKKMEDERMDRGFPF